MVKIHPDIDITKIPPNVFALAKAFDGIKVMVSIAWVSYASDDKLGFSVNVGIFHDTLIGVENGVEKVVGTIDCPLFEFSFNHDGTRVEYDNDSGSIYRDDDRIHEGWIE